jgi:predicted dithiol-disulfide oxidoreductase (DUF899 family)
VVGRDAWITARKDLLALEKQHTRLTDALSAKRRSLPWVLVDKPYVFDGPRGRQTLSQLFAGRHQLIVWHFMFGPAWKEGCSHCSFWADSFNANAIHLRHRDATMIAVSQAPLKKILPFKKRMGWTFPWVSAALTDFNFDYHASARPEELKAARVSYNYRMIEPFSDQLHGVSVFYKDPKGAVYHTYSTYARGVDILNTAYQYLDLTPKGRDEVDADSSWVRHHDKYRG